MGIAWGASGHKNEDGGPGVSPIVALCVVLLAVGVAAPRLRQLAPAEGSGGKGYRPAVFHAGVNRARTFTTKSRMAGIKEAMRFYVKNHGEPPKDLDEITGDKLDRDGWNHEFRYIAPERDSFGYVRSYGPDGKRSADDIWIRLRWNELSE